MTCRWSAGKRGRRTVALALALVAGSCLSSGWAHAGKLDKANDRAKRGKPDRDSGGSRSSGSSSGSGSRSRGDDGGDVEFAALIFYYTVLSPFSIPHAIAESGNPPPRYPARYPFASPECGAYCRAPRRSARPGEDSPTQPGFLYLSMDGGFDPEPLGFFGVGFDGAFAEVPLGLDTRVQFFYEDDGGVTDRGLVGKSHLTYRFAIMTQIQFRLGLGLRYFRGPSLEEPGTLDDTRAGFDFLYAFDIQWAKPVDTQIEFGLGNAGSAFVGQVRGSIGVWLGPTRLGLGWDQHWVADVPLGGPFLNFGVYF